MKRLFISFFLVLAALVASAQEGEYPVYGSLGGLDIRITLPEGFNPETDKCPMVILMHGVFSKKESKLITAIAMGLPEEGIGTISFDFGGQGKSEGQIEDMTIENQIVDARAILEYTRKLPYVSQIGFLGHSQGGVVASMTAGRLAQEGSDIPVGLVLIAPGSIIKEACENGIFFNARFDPADPPEKVKIFGSNRALGREYILGTQQLDIFGTAALYKGPVYIIHGSRDNIVPLWCSERFMEAYDGRATLSVVDGASHIFSGKREEAVIRVIPFFKLVFNN